VFAYFTSSPQQPFRRVLHAGIILASILISCSGILLMFWKHGSLFLQSFWGDQIGDKLGLAGSPWRVSLYVLLYFPFLLPLLLCHCYLWTERSLAKRSSRKTLGRIHRLVLGVAARRASMATKAILFAGSLILIALSFLASLPGHREPVYFAGPNHPGCASIATI